MAEFMQEQRCPSGDAGREEYPLSERDGGDRGATERPSANARRQSAASNAHARELGKLPQQLLRNRFGNAHQCSADAADDTHRSPRASISIDTPSVRTTTDP